MARESGVSPIKFVIFRTTGVVATIPTPSTLRKSHANFLDTDLEVGEFAKNIVDHKIFYRTSSEIIEFDDDALDIISDHAALSNLDYESAGHTGFSPDTHLHEGIYVEVGGEGDPIDISDWFEIVDAGLETEYLRVKKHLCGDGEIQPWTDSGQLPPTIWEALPPATASSIGGFKLWEAQFTIVDGVLKIKDSVIAPATHNHDDRYFTESETNTAISDAIAALQGTAPATLDTLQEIADVFQDDPNMITSILSTLSGKANVNANTTGSAGSIVTTNFSITEVAGELVIKYGTTIIAKITSAGYLSALDDVEPFGI